MNGETIDWKALERLRAAFLDGTAGQRDYWRNEGDLESYDQTFAQRIRWKWDYVLRELKQRGWSAPLGPVFDWGCGTGVAARAFAEHFAAGPIHYWDRSALAMRFAMKNLTGQIGRPATRPFGVLLASHVLNELTERQREELIALAQDATTVMLVEPGTYDASRGLIAIREQLRESFHIVAPCTHQVVCGLLAPENDRHWCHHFAPSPPEVFTDGNWARFATLAGIDLRSLPVSFLVLDRREPPQPPTPARVIGRPRVYKAHALVLRCDASGVREQRVTKRERPEEFRRLKKAGK